MLKKEVTRTDDVTTHRFDIPSVVMFHSVPDSLASKLVKTCTALQAPLESARSSDPAEFEVVLLMSGTRGWHGTFAGKPTHYALINRSYATKKFVVGVSGKPVDSFEVEGGYAQVKKMPSCPPSGFSIEGPVSSTWVRPDKSGSDPIFLDRKVTYVEPGDYVATRSLGVGYSLQERGPHPYKLDCEGVSFRSTTAKLEMPAFLAVSPDWGTAVCAAAVYEAVERNHPHDPHDHLGPEVVEEIHGSLPSTPRPEGMSAVAFIWLMTLVHCMGGRVIKTKKRADGKTVFKAMLMAGLIAYVTALSCTTNSQCPGFSNPVTGTTCIFGTCLPKGFDGGMCDDSADCWVNCGCATTNPPRGSCLRCGATQTQTPTTSSSKSSTPASTPTSTSTRFPSSSSSGSITVSATSTSSSTGSVTSLPSSTASMSVLPSASVSASTSASQSAGPTTSPSSSAFPSSAASETPSATSGPTGSATPAGTASASVTALPTASNTAAVLPSTTMTASSAPTATPTMIPTSQPSASVTASTQPTQSISMTALPSSSSSLTSTPSHSQSQTLSMSAVWPTSSASRSPLASAALLSSMIDGHFNHNQERGETLVTSSGPRLGGIFIGIFAAAVEAATCVGSRLARTSAELQLSGTSTNSTAGNYTYDSSVRYGIEEPTQVGVYCEDTYAPPPLLEVIEHGSRSLKQLVVSTSPVFIYLDNNVITLRFLDAQPREVEVNAMGMYWNAATETATYYLALPNEVFYKTTSIVVRTRVNGLPESESAFTVEGRMPCVVEDCWICNLSQWDCIPKILKAVLVVFILLCCVVLLWVLFQCGATIMAICSLGANCGLFTTRAVWNSLSRQGKAMADWAKKNGARDVQRAVVIAAMLSGVLACDDSFTISASSLQKVVYPDHSEYSLTMNTELTMRGPGSTSCIIFSDGESLVAQLVIRQSSSLMVCDLVNPYYTSAFSVYALSSFRCNGAGPCPDDCDSITPRDAYGEFNSTNWISYPGETRCTRRCQGFACGCILPASGCVYTTYSVLPEKPTARVSEVSVCNRQPSFLYELTDSEGQTIATGEIETVSELGEDGDVVIEILTQSYPNLPQDFPTHLVQTKAESTLLSSSRRGSPQQGMVGDIQSDSNAQLNSGDFIYDPRIIQRYDEKNKHDKVVSSRPGIDSLRGQIVLPAVIGRSVWSTNTDPDHWATKIQSFDPSAEKTTLAVKTKGNYTVSTVKNVVCPVITFVSMEGCHDCESGAKATFTVRSKCLQGSVLVTGEGVVSRMVTLATSETTESVVFRTDKEDYDEKWSFGDVTVRVEGELQMGFELEQQTLLYNGTDRDSASKTFRLGEWKWWEYTVFSIVLGVALVSVIAVLVLCVYPSVKTALLARKLLAVKKDSAPIRVDTRPAEDARVEAIRRRLKSLIS